MIEGPFVHLRRCLVYHTAESRDMAATPTLRAMYSRTGVAGAGLGVGAGAGVAVEVVDGLDVVVGVGVGLGKITVKDVTTPTFSPFAGRSLFSAQTRQ